MSGREVLRHVGVDRHGAEPLLVEGRVVEEILRRVDSLELTEFGLKLTDGAILEGGSGGRVQ
jgi:hypothetical protein